MDPGELARPRLLLGPRSGKKKIVNSLDRKYLCVVEVADHAVVLEVFEQKGQPLRGVCAHAKIDEPAMNFRIDFDFILLWLKGDRPAGSPSTVLGNFSFRRPNVDYLVAASLPLFFFNPAIDLRRLSFSRNEIRIELQVGQALVP